MEERSEEGLICGYFCAELSNFCDGNFGCIFCPIKVEPGVGM